MLLTALFTVALAAQSNDTPPPPPPKATAQSAPKAHGKAAAKNTPPDPDLIGFLGDYEDAADGLDPIGLSEQMTDDDKPAADEKKKGGHEP